MPLFFFASKSTELIFRLFFSVDSSAVQLFYYCYYLTFLALFISAGWKLCGEVALIMGEWDQKMSQIQTCKVPWATQLSHCSLIYDNICKSVCVTDQRKTSPFRHFVLYSLLCEIPTFHNVLRPKKMGTGHTVFILY